MVSPCALKPQPNENFFSYLRDGRAPPNRAAPPPIIVELMIGPL